MSRLKNFGFLVKDVSRLYVRHFEQHAHKLGMTLTQCKVLVYLSRNEGTTQKRLSELTDTDPMTLVRILDRMEVDAWIERRADPNDRRAYRLHLRPAAAPVLAEILRVADRARGEALGGLAAAEQTQLVTLLEKVHANLTKLVPGPSEAVKEPSSPARTRPLRRRSSGRRRKLAS
jgi:MarR family transcriptional regulator, transcriptional regulator for hemolysin